MHILPNTQRPEACNFIKKEMLAQVFFCEFFEISKNTFFIEYLQVTGSEVSQNSSKKSHLMTNWNHSLYVLSWNLLKGFYEILIVTKLNSFSLVHKHLLFYLLHPITSNYFNQTFIFSNEKSRTRAKGMSYLFNMKIKKQGFVQSR